MIPGQADLMSQTTTAEYAVHLRRFELSAPDIFPLDDSSNINEQRLLSSNTT
jgi:hypothetical protein